MNRRAGRTHAWHSNGEFTALSLPFLAMLSLLNLCLLLSCLIGAAVLAFQPQSARHSRLLLAVSNDAADNVEKDLSSLLTARFPTSVEDQVRQASEALKRATADNKHRHSIRLLLPLIGATELDDWPGGARQMMKAAEPLLDRILRSLDASTKIQESVIDNDDGVVALLAQASDPKGDSCTVLLPSADTVSKIESTLEPQVGPERNLILVNSQWKRKSDFSGGFFGGRDKLISYVEQFEPTFHCSNLMVESEQIRILRTYPGPWRVFLRVEKDSNVEWKEIGRKHFLSAKPATWDSEPDNQRDGGRVFDYGQPSYAEIIDMKTSMPDYQPKSLAERASAAFTFIKDTL
jgi:hypothetical protein